MEILENYISIHYEVDIGYQHLSLSKDEVQKIVDSDEECKKIRVLSKAYIFPDRSSRWIVLLSDDMSLKGEDGRLYYWTYSNERYGTEVMNNFDKETIQKWLDIRLPLLHHAKK